MSAHTCQKAQRQYKQRLLSERESNQPLISTAMSVEERVRRLRECREVDAARAVNRIHATRVPSAACANDAYNTGQHYDRLEVRTKH